jgi:hypothetical protein
MVFFVLPLGAYFLIFYFKKKYIYTKFKYK